MVTLPRRMMIIGMILVLLTVLLITTATRATTTSHSTIYSNWENMAIVNPDITDKPPTLLNNKLPPSANRDSCLHCHIKGEETGLWTPLARWVVFLTFGGIFTFGIIRTTSAWRKRVPWKPVHQRIGDWLEDRFQYRDPLSKIFEKPVPDWQRRWWYCLGGLTFFFAGVQGITGIMLAFYYKPTPEAAFASIQFIENEVFFGAGIRMIHHWSANGMVLMCVAHMMRVYIMGAYKNPRELNWMSGVILLVMTLAFGFTGYLLPWDQRAFWATTVGSEIAGSIPVIGDLALVFLRFGWDVSGSTLSRFYALHILILPLITIAAMLAHFIMIRRQGIMKPL